MQSSEAVSSLLQDRHLLARPSSSAALRNTRTVTRSRPVSGMCFYTVTFGWGTFDDGFKYFFNSDTTERHLVFNISPAGPWISFCSANFCRIIHFTESCKY